MPWPTADLAIKALPATKQRLFACRTARRFLEFERASGREPDPACWAAIEVATRYAVGTATQKELMHASANVLALGSCEIGRVAIATAIWALRVPSEWPASYHAAAEVANWAAWLPNKDRVGGIRQERSLQFADLLNTLAR